MTTPNERETMDTTTAGIIAQNAASSDYYAAVAQREGTPRPDAMPELDDLTPAEQEAIRAQDYDGVGRAWEAAHREGFIFALYFETAWRVDPERNPISDDLRGHLETFSKRYAAAIEANSAYLNKHARTNIEGD